MPIQLVIKNNPKVFVIIISSPTYYVVMRYCSLLMVFHEKRPCSPAIGTSPLILGGSVGAIGRSSMMTPYIGLGVLWMRGSEKHGCKWVCGMCVCVFIYIFIYIYVYIYVCVCVCVSTEICAT